MFSMGGKKMRYAKFVKIPIRIDRIMFDYKCGGCKSKINKGNTVCFTQVNFKFSECLCLQCGYMLLAAYRDKLNKIEVKMFGKYGGGA